MELGGDNELNDVGYCVWLVIEYSGERCGEVRTSSRVHSAFGENVFYGCSDIARGVYENVCLEGIGTNFVGPERSFFMIWKSSPTIIFAR